MSLCEEQGHTYVVGEMACVECGHKYDCEQEGHYSPDLLTRPNCLVCGGLVI